MPSSRRWLPLEGVGVPGQAGNLKNRAVALGESRFLKTCLPLVSGGEEGDRLAGSGFSESTGAGVLVGFLGGASGKEPTCQCRRQEVQVQSLGQEHPLEKEMVTHSSVLAWEIPWTEEPGSLHSIELQGWT